MATYRNVQGGTIQALSSDPSNPVKGEVWYNTTSNTFKIRTLVATNAWASGGAMATAPPARSEASYGTAYGTQTSMMFVMGNGVPTGNADNSQTYDGSAWSAGPTMVQTNYAVGAVGDNSAPSPTPGASGGGPAILFGSGTPTAQVDSYTWDTTSFALSPADNSLSRWAPFGFGTVPTANAWGGNATPTYTNTGEVFDGTSWSNSPATMVQARSTNTGGQYGAGTTLSATIAGGITPPASTPNTQGLTEEWSGTSWSAKPVMNTGRRGSGMVGATSTYALIFCGGYPGATTGSTAAELWDGSTWTTTASLANFKQYVSTAGFQCGGDTGGTATPTLRYTEEWTGSLEATGTITTS